MKKKLVWGIIACIFGFLFSLGFHQYLGAAIIFVGIVLIDLYCDEKKLAKKDLVDYPIIKDT